MMAASQKPKRKKPKRKKPPRAGPTTPGPSMAEAARFLRTLASGEHLNVPDPARTAADLRLIADLIEGKGKVTWRKGRRHSLFEQQEINLAALMVERKAPGDTVKAALDRWAKRLALQFGRSGVDDTEEIRDHIVTARKRQRKAGWPFVEK